MAKREYYLDNLRSLIVICVVLFHVVEIFNSTGSVIHFNAPGIAAIDTFAYAVYPWFMGALFVISGICAKHSLDNRSKKQFAKERFLKLLLPFITYMLLFSVPTAAISFNSMGGWTDFAAVPRGILYFVMMLIGMGHAWFLLELFIISMVFLLIIVIDKENRLRAWGEKANIWLLLALYFPLLGAAQVLNVLGVMRNLFFLLLFLLGYCVLSHECVRNRLKKCRLGLLCASVLLFIVLLFVYFGKSFGDILNKPLVVLFSYITILTLFAFAPSVLNFTNAFWRYMRKKSFMIYLFHYLPMISLAYITVNYLALPIALNYAIVLVSSSLATLLICALLPKIPFIRFLFGIRSESR